MLFINYGRLFFASYFHFTSMVSFFKIIICCTYGIAEKMNVIGIEARKKLSMLPDGIGELFIEPSIAIDSFLLKIGLMYHLYGLFTIFSLEQIINCCNSIIFSFDISFFTLLWFGHQNKSIMLYSSIILQCVGIYIYNVQELLILKSMVLMFSIIRCIGRLDLYAEILYMNKEERKFHYIETFVIFCISFLLNGISIYSLHIIMIQYMNLLGGLKYIFIIGIVKAVYLWIHDKLKCLLFHNTQFTDEAQEIIIETIQSGC